MECREVQERLSEYHDDELSPGARSSVARHVQGCSRCSAELAVFGQLSAIAKELDDPETPPGVWADIEARLDADGDSGAVRPGHEESRPRRGWRLGLLAAAAMVLIATGVVWMVGEGRHAANHHSELAVDFGEYLERFAGAPETAHNVLLAKYDGQGVDVAEATRQLGYRPAVAAGLPRGYSLEAMYVLKMPCCTCVQSICRRSDGRVFALFEHDEAQPIWFGDCPQVKTQCDGRSCSVIQSDRTLVASWKANQRQLTVVGADDLEEIADLMEHLGGGSPDS